MIRLLSIVILVSLTSFCFSQERVKTKAGGLYSGILLTKITKARSSEDNGRDISRIVYISNKTGDSLSVYTVAAGVVTTAINYSIVAVKNSLYLNIRSIDANQQQSDSLRINFHDSGHSLLINKNDRYLLYPAFYTRFKQGVQGKHSVMAVLSLLEDNIGDYPIADSFSLLLFSRQAGNDKRIQHARIVTQRSQSENITDTWACAYHYNKNGKLDSVSAVSGKEIRFYKKINYTGDNVITIKSYRNIEDRQITERVITYPVANTSLLKWNDHILETGKNLQTDLSISLTKKGLGSIRAMTMSQAEILNLISQTL